MNIFCSWDGAASGAGVSSGASTEAVFAPEPLAGELSWLTAGLLPPHAARVPPTIIIGRKRKFFIKNDSKNKNRHNKICFYALKTSKNVIKLKKIHKCKRKHTLPL
jgi:hypothetical protein